MSSVPTAYSGSIGKASLTGLVDAYSQVTGVDWQHQLYSTLSNKPGVCVRYRQNQAMVKEKWLIVIQTAYRSDQHLAPFAPGTYQIGVGITDSDGTLRTVDATFKPFGRNCAEGGQQEATGGTITYTLVTDTLVEASYDLLFGRSQVQGGGFSAPTCVLCAPSPTARTCLRH
jgi:hypothetical protein